MGQLPAFAGNRPESLRDYGTTHNEPGLRSVQDGIHPEQKARVNQLEIEYRAELETKKRILEMLKGEITKLGALCPNITIPYNFVIPDGCYRYKTECVPGYVKFQCYFGTKIYRDLLGSGFLKQHMPQWYATGDF